MNARDRIGKGPWMNAKGVIIAKDVAELHGDPLPGVLSSSTRKNLGGRGAGYAAVRLRWRWREKYSFCASMNAARSGVSSFGVIALFLKE